MPATMTLVLGAAPPQERGRMMALLGLPIMLGPILAPVLGGWLLDTFSWRWMFLINLPIGAVAVLLGMRNLPNVPTGPRPSMDWLGLALLPPGMSLLVFAASRVESGALPWGTTALFGTGVILVVAFTLLALRMDTPLLNVRLLGQRFTGGGTAVLVLYTGATMGALILMPLYWQVLEGESALRTGLFMAPGAVAAAAVIRLSGSLIDAFAPLVVIGSGIAATAIGYALLAIAVANDAPSWVIIAGWVVVSVGSAFTVMPATTTATRHLPPTDIPSGTTLLQVTAQISAAFSVVVVSVLLASRLSTHLDAPNATISALAALPPAERAHVAPQIADAFAETFWLPTALTTLAGLLAIGVFRRLPAPKPRGEAHVDQPTPAA